MNDTRRCCTNPACDSERVPRAGWASTSGRCDGCDRAAALAEVATYLSAHNENVTRGYLVACIRDLAQMLIAERERANAAEARLRLAPLKATLYGHDCDL